MLINNDLTKKQDLLDARMPSAAAVVLPLARFSSHQHRRAPVSLNPRPRFARR